MRGEEGLQQHGTDVGRGCPQHGETNEGGTAVHVARRRFDGALRSPGRGGQLVGAVAARRGEGAKLAEEEAQAARVPHGD